MIIRRLILALLGGTLVLAANPEPSNTFKFGDGTPSNKSLIFNRQQGSTTLPTIRWNEASSQLEFTNDGTNYNGIGSGSGSGGAGINVLTNPGFESGVAQGWVNTGGAFLSVSSGSNVLFGAKSATFQAFGSGQNFQSSLYSIPNGLLGTNCAAGIFYLGGDTGLTFEVLDGSGNILNSQVMSPVTTTTAMSLSFVCPASGSFKLEVLAAGSTALVAVDNASLGSSPLSQVSQTQFIGSAYINYSSCAWQRANTALGPFGTNASCGAPVVEYNPGPGTISSTIDNLPDFTVNNLPPGNYEVKITGEYTFSGNNDVLAINDGVTTTGHIGTDNHQGIAVVGYFNYTTAGTHTFSVWSSQSAASTGTLYGGDSLNWRLRFSIVQFPIAPTLAYNASQVANSFVAYHDWTCVWSTSSTSQADFGATTTCNFVVLNNQNFGSIISANNGTVGDYLPGISFTPSRAGTYEICAYPVNYGNTTAGGALFFLTSNGVSSGNFAWGEHQQGVANEDVINNPVCGHYTANNVNQVTIKLQARAYSSNTINIVGNTPDSPAVVWTGKQIDYQTPAPLLVNTVVSASNGVENINRLVFGGNSTATTGCGVSPCTIAFESGSWVTSVTRLSVGLYQVNFAVGAFSSQPACFCNDRGVNSGFQCNVYARSGTTSISLQTLNSGSAVDEAADVLCMGPH